MKNMDLSTEKTNEEGPGTENQTCDDDYAKAGAC
jgi:hypothetical protein